MNKGKRDHIIHYLNNGTRYDGRKNEEYRKIEVETSLIKTAEGSAKVKIGDTEVIAGVKFEVGQPYPDSPDAGTMMVNTELVPLSSPDFESGPPGIEAIEISRVVDRGIRESGAIDFKKLCIKPGELVWTIIVDVVPLNATGNLFDAASLAVMLAIKDAKFPELQNDKINYKKLTKDSIPMEEEPISVTVLKIGGHFIVDPIPDEEKVLDSRLTVASLKDGTICAMQKGGENPLESKDIKKMVELSLKKAKELRKYLK